MTLTKKKIAELVGCSYQTLYNINKELPDDEKLFVETEGGCDLGEFIRRWTRFHVNDAMEGVKDLDQIKAAHEKVKTRKTELEVSRMEGSLVDVGDVRRLWDDIANTVMQNALHLPATLAPMLQGQDNAEVIKAIIDREIRKVLEEISEAPLPGYAQTEDEEGEGET